MIQLFFNRAINKFYYLIGRRLDSLFISRENVPIIISNNCWGAGIYQNLKMQYITPFVGLYILPDDYVKLVKGFERYINAEIIISKVDDYPIGKLDDITIYFLHYSNAEEAKIKFARRMKRLKKELGKRNLLFKFCDVDFTNEDSFELISSFHHHASVHGSAISFSKSQLDIDNNFRVNGIKTPNGVELFNQRYKYLVFFKFIKSLR